MKAWVHLTNCEFNQVLYMHVGQFGERLLTIVTAISVIAHHLGVTIIPAHITDWQIYSTRADIHSATISAQSIIILCGSRISESYFTVSAA